MAVDDGSGGSGYVAMRFGFVQLAGLAERCKHGPVLRACVVTCEECVFALQRDGADCALNHCPTMHVYMHKRGRAVHIDAAIGQAQDQPVPVFGDVFEGCACWGLGRHLRASVIQSGF